MKFKEPTPGSPKSHETPKTLYHASPRKDLQRIEPRQGSRRGGGPDEGHVVFATPDKRLATIFLLKSDDTWTASGFVDDGAPYMLIAKDRDEFIKEDSGGAIYEFPGEGFTTDPDRGLGVREWMSKHHIEPQAKEEHHSALEAMLVSGVRVYFVDKDTLKQFHAANGEEKAEILGKLKPE